MNNKHRNFKDQFVHSGVEVTGTRLHREMLQFRLRLHTSSCPALCVCVRLRACVRVLQWLTCGWESECFGPFLECQK